MHKIVYNHRLQNLYKDADSYSLYLYMPCLSFDFATLVRCALALYILTACTVQGK
jgi:hypothetical protein